eukprot:1541709-Rhodomonas_salina.1
MEELTEVLPPTLSALLSATLSVLRCMEQLQSIDKAVTDLLRTCDHGSDVPPATQQHLPVEQQPRKHPHGRHAQP